MTARKWTRRVVAIATLAGATAFGVIEAVPAAAAGPSQTTCDRIHSATQGNLEAQAAVLRICGSAPAG